MAKRMRIGYANPNNRILTADQGSMAVTGRDATLDYDPVSSGNRTVGDEIFVMTNGSGDGPLYGFDSYTTDANGAASTIDITRVATGGPANRPYLRYEISGPGSEASAAWNLDSPYGPPSSPTVTRGESLFIRFSYRPIGHYNQTQKIVSQNTNGTVSDARNITTIKQYNEGWLFGQGIDGGDIPVFPVMTGFTTWRHVQIELRYSTTEGATNGYHKVWVGTDTYGSPTYEASGPVAWRANNVVGEESLSFCGYHQANLVANPREFHIADFRIGPTFDTNWSSSGA